MRTDYQVVVVYDQVSDGGCGHIEAQRLPVLAIIGRKKDFPLGSGEEQTRLFWVFPHYIDGVVGYTFGNVLPGFAPIMCAVDMWTQIIKPKSIYGQVGCLRIEMAGIDLGYFIPGAQGRRRYVAPGSPSIAGDVHQPIICTSPNHAGIQVGWPYRINDSSAGHFFQFRRSEGTDTLWYFRLFAG